MKRISYIIILGLIFNYSSATAQTKKWTLNECMQYAIENSPRKNRQQAQNIIYQQELKNAIGNLLPSIEANTSASFNFGRGLDAGTNSYVDVNSFNNNYNLYGSLTLFDGLASISRVRMNSVNKIKGKHELNELEDIIAYETMDAFFRVVYYEEMISLAEQQVDESTENLRQIERMEELGLKGFPDVAEMRAKQAKDNYNLTRQKNLLIVELIKLKTHMNYPLNDSLSIVKPEINEMIVKTNETVADLYEQSLSYLPKALTAETSLKAKKLSLQEAKGNLSPRLSLGGGFSTNFFRYMDGSEAASFTDQFRDKRGYYVQFTLSVPIFNGFTRSVQVKKSKQQVVIEENNREETLRTLHSEIEQAIADMNGQADEYHQAKIQVNAMDVAHEVNKRKYNEGMVSAIDLNTSSNRLLQAKVDELNAKLMYQLKTKLVGYYKGEPFIQ